MDTEARLNEWIDLYATRLFRLACTYTGNTADAEDRVQDALIKAYKAMPQLSNLEQPFPWLARIVINECRSSYRKKGREVLTETMPSHHVISAEDIAIHRIENDLMYGAVFRLPEKYRLPIVLYHFEELPVVQIAEILQLSEGAVKTRLSRARKQLAKWVKEVSPDERRTATAEC